MTSGFFWTFELAGLVYMNHSIEKSIKFTNLLSCLGNVASLFSCKWSFLRFDSWPIFSGNFPIKLSLIYKNSKLWSCSKLGGNSLNWFCDATSFWRFANFHISLGRVSIKFWSIFRTFRELIVDISSGSVLILFSDKSILTKFLLNRFRLTNFRLMRGIFKSVSCEFWSRWYFRLGAIAAFGPLEGLLEAN